MEQDLRTWAEVDLDAIRHNAAEAARLSPGAAVMPVVKANAYGHGDIAVAKALGGYGRFAVATAEEALRLRHAGILAPVLVLGAVPPHCVPELAATGVAVCCGSLASAERYAAAMQKVQPAYTLAVHLKIDTGMARLGFAPGEAAAAAKPLAALPGIAVEAVFTHFAMADEEPGDGFTARQHELFCETAEALRGVWPALQLHAANSGGILRHPEAVHDVVRPGIMLYGYAPAPHSAGRADLRPALSWHARIAGVREVKKDEPVGYGMAWRAPRDSRIATVCAGYADGLHRAGSGAHQMLVHGQRVPQVGRVCMDMCMLDVTGVPNVQAGDTATLLGMDAETGASVTAEDMAAAAGTISYEVLCAISPRVPRIYKGEA